MLNDVRRVIEQVSRDRGIDKEILVKTLEEALKSAARKKYGTKIDIEVHYNDELGEIEVFQFKDVVEEIVEPDLELTLKEARKLDPECEVGDSIGTKMDTSVFGRIAAQSAKQVIIQKMKDAERSVVYDSFFNRKGEIINGIVQRIDRRDIIVNLGRTEAVLPVREQVPRENYRRGERIRAFILDVLQESRGPQIILSRSHPSFLIALFKTEVPEISEGIVNIMAAAREPGSRAKVAVTSNDSDIDPVGACVGMKGSRVQSVVHELKGEKIDIIPWRTDPAKFVCNALAPAEIARVVVDEGNRAMEVIVPDEYLSVAIGKRGQNVRLASKLTGWNIDVKSETNYTQAMQTGYDALLRLPGVGAGTADSLREEGFFSVEEIAGSSIEELTQVKGVSDKKAQNLIDAAAEALEHADEMPDKESGEEAPPELPAEDAGNETEDEVKQTATAADDGQAEEPGEEASQEIPAEDAGSETADEVKQTEAAADDGQAEDSSPEIPSEDEGGHTGDDVESTGAEDEPEGTEQEQGA